MKVAVEVKLQCILYYCFKTIKGKYIKLWFTFLLLFT